MQSTICCNAEARGALRDLSYPFKDDHSSHLQEDVNTVHSKDGCLTLTLWVWPCAFLRRIQPSMKHVRLMIFCNWISKKAGDKVPHTPLILPISTAGLERALLCGWIRGKERERSVKQGDRRWRGARIASGQMAAKSTPTPPNARGLIAVSVPGGRQARGGRASGTAARRNEGDRVQRVRPQQQTLKLLLSEVVRGSAFTTNKED